MTYSQIIQSINKKAFKPIYFLHGNESYFIDTISKLIEEKALAEHERSFNQTILYGKEATYHQIVDNARRYPMMAERQVVILKEAQEMRELKRLDKYVAQPTASTILVICHKHKKFDKRSKLAKALKKSKAVIEFEAKTLYDNQIAAWISDYLKQKKYSIKENASQLIAEYLGTNLSKVANELDKLILNIPEGETITTEHVQKNIGISKDYNVFELHKALGQRNILKIQRITNYFIANPKGHALPQIISSLFGFFSKIYIAHFHSKANDQELAQKIGLRSAYFVRDYRQALRVFSLAKTEQIIGLLKEYDLKSKGVERNSTPDGELLKELIFKIMH